MSSLPPLQNTIHELSASHKKLAALYCQSTGLAGLVKAIESAEVAIEEGIKPKQKEAEANLHILKADIQRLKESVQLSLDVKRMKKQLAEGEQEKQTKEAEAAKLRAQRSSCLDKMKALRQKHGTQSDLQRQLASLQQKKLACQEDCDDVSDTLNSFREELESLRRQKENVEESTRAAHFDEQATMGEEEEAMMRVKQIEAQLNSTQEILDAFHGIHLNDSLSSDELFSDLDRQRSALLSHCDSLARRCLAIATKDGKALVPQFKHLQNSLTLSGPEFEHAQTTARELQAAIQQQWRKLEDAVITAQRLADKKQQNIRELVSRLYRTLSTRSGMLYLTAEEIQALQEVKAMSVTGSWNKFYRIVASFPGVYGTFASHINLQEDQGSARATKALTAAIGGSERIILVANSDVGQRVIDAAKKCTLSVRVWPVDTISLPTAPSECPVGVRPSTFLQGSGNSTVDRLIQQNIDQWRVVASDTEVNEGFSRGASRLVTYNGMKHEKYSLEKQGDMLDFVAIRRDLKQLIRQLRTEKEAQANLNNGLHSMNARQSKMQELKTLAIKLCDAVQSHLLPLTAAMTKLEEGGVSSASLKSLEESLDALSEERVRARMRVDQVLLKKKETQKQLGTLEETMATLNSKLVDCHSSLDKNKVKLEKLRQRQHELVEECDRVSAALLKIKEQVEEEDDSELQQIERAISQHKRDTTVLQARMDGIRKRMKALEEDLPRDVEEITSAVDGIRVRADKLMKEKAKVDTALEALDGTVTGHCEALKEINSKVFQECRALFKDYTSAIFDDFLRCELRVTEAGQPHEGVAVVAKPRGKDQSRKLTALSGGQQALIGLAYALALGTLQKPSVSLLDEVDADLDASMQHMVIKLIQVALLSDVNTLPYIFVVSHHDSFTTAAQHRIIVKRSRAQGVLLEYQYEQ